jgi:DNA invertase Pin-like site-specific DNA recombinase
MSLERLERARLCPPYKRDPVSSGPAVGVFAEFETNLRRENQLEGIAKAKAAGVYKGRKPSIDVTRIKALKASGLGPTEIARKLKKPRLNRWLKLADDHSSGARRIR